MNAHINRRGCLSVALAVASASQARAAETATSLGNRAHFLARPEFRPCQTGVSRGARGLLLPGAGMRRPYGAADQ